MLDDLKKARFPVEIGLLLAFCLFLPLVEVWKNVALLAYLVAWTVNRARARDFGGAWRWSDTLFVVWIGAAYLAAMFAGLGGNAWAKTGDVAASALLFWLVSRAGYASREMRGVLGALVISTIIGLIYGYWRIWRGTIGFGRLELHSVGHVNHTAIYLAIMLGVCASWLFARWQVWHANCRAAALVVVAFVLASLVVTASRAAIAVGFLTLLVLASAWWPRWRAPLVGSAIAILVITVTLVGFRAEVVRKQADYAAAHNVLAFRDRIWRMGIAAWEKYPWFGVGKDNYGLITHDLVRSWRAEAGKDYHEEDYDREPHAHSLFINTLVERGAVGFSALAAALLAWLIAIVRFRPRPQEDGFAWLMWGAATCAWIVTVGVGVVNTTLHHEHGLLAALLLGLWLSTTSAHRVS